MSKAESGPKVKVEVRTLRSTQSDDIAKITVGGDEVKLFKTNKNPSLRVSRNKTGVIVEANWQSNFAYGIDENGSLTDNPHTLRQGEKMNLRALGAKGILTGIPDAVRITHLSPEKNEK